MENKSYRLLDKKQYSEYLKSIFSFENPAYRIIEVKSFIGNFNHIFEKQVIKVEGTIQNEIYYISKNNSILLTLKTIPFEYSYLIPFSKEYILKVIPKVTKNNSKIFFNSGELEVQISFEIKLLSAIDITAEKENYKTNEEYKNGENIKNNISEKEIIFSYPIKSKSFIEQKIIHLKLSSNSLEANEIKADLRDLNYRIYENKVIVNGKLGFGIQDHSSLDIQKKDYNTIIDFSDLSNNVKSFVNGYVQNVEIRSISTKYLELKVFVKIYCEIFSIVRKKVIEEIENNSIKADKSSINYYSIEKKNIRFVEINESYDILPKAKKIIHVKGSLSNIKKELYKKTNQNIKGMLQIFIYYITEGDREKLKKLSMPFSIEEKLTEDNQNNENSLKEIKGDFDYFVWELSQGKDTIKIKSIIALEIKTVSKGNLTFLSDILNDNIEFKKASIEMKRLIYEDDIILKEKNEITPEYLPNDILGENIWLENINTTIINEKVLIQGELIQEIYYSDEIENEHYLKNKVPIGIFVAIPYGYENMKVLTKSLVSKSSVDSNQQKGRIICNSDIKFKITALEDENINPVISISGDENKNDSIICKGLYKRNLYEFPIKTYTNITKPSPYKIKEIKLKVKELNYIIDYKEIIVEGSLEKEIFYVGKDNLLHNCQESLCFSYNISYPLNEKDELLDIKAVTKLKGYNLEIERAQKNIKGILNIDFDLVLELDFLKREGGDQNG